MSNYNQPQIFFPDEFDDQSVFEMSFKGWVNVKVDLGKEGQYLLTFINLARLQQELEDNVREGIPCLSEPGLVVLSEISLDSIRSAVLFLCQKNYFSHLLPSNQEGYSRPLWPIDS
jgi:hypothetical protein